MSLCISQLVSIKTDTKWFMSPSKELPVLTPFNKLRDVLSVSCPPSYGPSSSRSNHS